MLKLAEDSDDNPDAKVQLDELNVWMRVGRKVLHK